MERGNNVRLAGYFVLGLLILVGLLFLSFSDQNVSLVGEVIRDIDLPESCDDGNISAVWDSVFFVDSVGITILKNDSLIGGKCSEYFANKSYEGIEYILYGHTESDTEENVSYVFAEAVNATVDYTDALSKMVVSLEDVETFNPTRNSTFLETYIQLRVDALGFSDSEKIFNETFKMNLSESWSEGVYLNNLSYDFSYSFTNSSYIRTLAGSISGNYSYAVFNFELSETETICEYDDDCESWSNCVDSFQNRTCLNFSTNCDGIGNIFSKNRTCGENCVQSWNIGNWSNCTGGSQIRSVYDTNNCGNNTGRPIGNQTCSEIIVVDPEPDIEPCVSDWSDCGSWSPLSCPEIEEQTRICGDKNECDNSSNSEVRSCVYESGFEVNWIFVAIIVFGIVLIGIVIVLFIKLFSKKRRTEPADTSFVFPDSSDFFGSSPSSNYGNIPVRLPAAAPVSQSTSKTPLPRNVITASPELKK